MSTPYWLSLLQTCSVFASLDNLVNAEIPMTQIQVFLLTEFGGDTEDTHHLLLLLLEEKQLTVRKQQFCFLFWIRQLNL